MFVLILLFNARLRFLQCFCVVVNFIKIILVFISEASSAKLKLNYVSQNLCPVFVWLTTMKKDVSCVEEPRKHLILTEDVQPVKRKRTATQACSDTDDI